MRVGYLIQAHDNPVHLGRLIASLSHPDCSFFIHIDKKTDLAPFQHLIDVNVEMIKNRVAVHWGDFSQVEATLNLIDAALKSPLHIDRFVFIGGTDYPIRSAQAIHAFFTEHAQKEFISIVELPNEKAGKFLTRISEYHLRNNWPALIRPVRSVLLRLRLFPRRRDYRRYLGDLTPYAGSSWWALTRPACVIISDFVQANSGIVRFFENASCADEVFFQTVLGNSPLRAHMVPNLTHTVWNAGASRPEYLNQGHLPEMLSLTKAKKVDVYGERDILFARKFSDKHGELLDQLDLHRH